MHNTQSFGPLDLTTATLIQYAACQIGDFKIAILICYDAEFPETFRQVLGAGANLVVVPTALGEVWGAVAERVISTRAFENGCFVCYANHSGLENGFSYLGGSCIVNPKGQDLARAGIPTPICISLK